MVRKINDGVVYRVGELDWVHGSFFTDSLDYYDHSATGYRKEDAKPYILDLTDAKVFDPVEEWNLSVEGWSDMRQTEEFFNSKGLDGYEYLDGVDYDDPGSYHEVMADADVLAAWAREHDYDAVIFRDVPTAGYGPSFTEYCVFNKGLVKPADLVERIVKKGSKWQVQSEDGTRNLGTYDTKAEAEKRLRQVHYFKHINEAAEETDSEGNSLNENQIEFFKDSKVRDGSGKLRVVYHGTDKEFESFSKGDVGFHFGTKGQAESRVSDLDDKRIGAYYLNIKNPLRGYDFGCWGAYSICYYWYLQSFKDEYSIFEDVNMSKDDLKRLLGSAERDFRKISDTECEALDKKEGYDSGLGKTLREVLKSKGYDGIVYDNYFEDSDMVHGDPSYIAFESSQIKSITNKNPSGAANINEADAAGSLPEDVKVATANIKGAEFSGSEPELLNVYVSVLPHAGWRAGTVSYKYALTQDQAEDMLDFLSAAPQARTLNLRLTTMRVAVESDDEPILYVLFDIFNNRVRGLAYRLYVESYGDTFDIAYINVEKPDASYSDPAANRVIGLGVDEVLGLDYCQMGQNVVNDVLNRFNAEYRRIHRVDEDIKISQADDTGVEFIGSKPDLIGEFITAVPPYDGLRSGTVSYVYKLTGEQAKAVADFASDAEPDMREYLSEFMSDAAQWGGSVGLAAYFSVLGDVVDADYRLTSDHRTMSLLDVRMTDVVKSDFIGLSGVSKNSLKIGLGIDTILGLNHFSEGPSVIISKLMAEYRRKGYSTKEDSLSEDVSVRPADLSGADFVGSRPELVDTDAYAHGTQTGRSGCVNYAYALTDEHVSALVGFLEGFSANTARNVRHFRDNFSAPDRPLLLLASLYMTEKGVRTLWYELSSFDRRWNMRLGSIHVSGREYMRSADSDEEELTDDVNEAAICLAVDKLFGLDYAEPSPATLETAMAEFDAEYQREHPLGEDVSIKAYAAHQKPFMYERRDNKESGDTHELWELPPDCVNTLADMLEDVDEGYGGLPTLLRHIADAGDSVTLAIDAYGDDDLMQYTLLAGGGNFILVYLPKGDLANGMRGYGDSEPVREAKLVRILDDVFGFDVMGRFLKSAHVDEDVEVRPSGSPLVKLIGIKYPNPRETIYMYSLGQEGLDRLLDAMLGAGRGFSANVYDDIRGGRFPNAQLNVRVNNQDRKTDVLQCAMYLMQTQGKSVLDYEPLCTVGLAMEGDRLVYGGDLDATLAIEKGLDLPYKHASDFIANAGTEPVHIVDEDVRVSASANTPPLLSSRVSPDGVSSYAYDLSEPELLAISRVVHDHEADLSMYTPASVDYMARKISKGDDFAVTLHIVSYELGNGYAAIDYRLDTSDSDGPIDSMTIAQCGGNKGNGTMEADKQAGVLFDIDDALGISHATELFRHVGEPAEEGLDEDVNVSASGDALTLLKDGKGAGGGHWWTYGINDSAAIRTLIRFAPSYGHMLSSVADLCDDPGERPVNPKLTVTAHPTFVKYDFHSDRSFNAILLYVTTPAAEDHTDVRRALMMERALGISHLPEWLSAEGTLTEPDAMEDRSWKDGSWKRLHSEDDEDSIPLSMAERYVQMDADDFKWSIRVKGRDGEWLYGRHYELDDQRLNGLMTLSQAYWLLPKAAEAGEADIVIDVTYNEDNAYSIMTMRRGG